MSKFFLLRWKRHSQLLLGTRNEAAAPLKDS